MLYGKKGKCVFDDIVNEIAENLGMQMVL